MAASRCAHADVTYIGDVYFDGTGTDLSGLGFSTLEDGVSPQNGLNGFGSGFGYAGGNLFYALGDRGPNKVAYNNGTLVDNTTSYDNRYQQFQVTATPVGSLNAQGHYGSYNIQANLVGTTLLKTPLGQQYVGISTAFSTNPNIENRRLDSEAIRVAPDGTTWVADEYGPYILHFNQQGQQIGSLPLPAGFQIANPAATATAEAANNTTGRTTNRGMEGLAISPDGKTLVGMMQSSLTQDGGLNGVNDRVLVYNISDLNNVPAPKQYVYQLDSKATPISELLAINDHQFLVDERDGNGGSLGATAVKKLYEFDLNQATPPTDISTGSFAGTTTSNGLPTTGTPAGVTVLNKSLFANIGSLLNAAAPWTTNPLNATGLPDKIEGYAWGPDLPDGRHLLLATNDNDFAQATAAWAASPASPTTSIGAGYPDYIFAFAVDPSDVPNFQQETFAPEPCALMGVAFAAAGLTRRRRS
jgi:hypothetical protein